MKTIIIATDGSKSSEHAGEMIKEYLKAFTQAELIILYVTSKEDYAYDINPEVVDHYEDQLTKEIKENMENIYQQWKHRVQFIHKVGHTSTTICHTAKENNADL